VNAFRHSRASVIQVALNFEPHRLEIEVTDNGIGIDPEILHKGRPTDHWGLPGMQERADNLGAELRINVPAGGGTRVRLVVPAAMAYRHADHSPSFWTFYRVWVARFRKRN
jgi:nitrate/nitrite-specific signal transduction histidine kinase